LSYQKPCYRDLARDEQEVEHFLNDTFPRIHRLADKLGADIGFEDEAGMGLMRRSGRTWGRVGSTPVVQVVIQRGGYNVLSIVTPKGDMLSSQRLASCRALSTALTVLGFFSANSAVKAQTFSG
jgi:hypothetical protein